MRWPGGYCGHDDAVLYRRAWDGRSDIMKVDGKHTRSIWLEPDGWSVGAIDQRRLPHEFVVARPESRRGSRRRHPHHAGPRGAADGCDHSVQALTLRGNKT